MFFYSKCQGQTDLASYELFSVRKTCVGLPITYVLRASGGVNIECLKIHRTNVIANNSTNNNVFFFISDLKIVYNNNYSSSIIMLWTREGNILYHDLFGDKIIQNCFKMEAIQ